MGEKTDFERLIAVLRTDAIDVALIDQAFTGVRDCNPPLLVRNLFRNSEEPAESAEHENSRSFDVQQGKKHRSRKL